MLFSILIQTIQLMTIIAILIIHGLDYYEIVCKYRGKSDNHTLKDVKQYTVFSIMLIIIITFNYFHSYFEFNFSLHFYMSLSNLFSMKSHEVNNIILLVDQQENKY